MANFLRAWKFETGFLLIISAALLIWAGTAYLSPVARQERAANAYLKNLEQQYKDDTYGGTTPEETLSLFISALEKGDIELASKYFLPEDREEMSKGLENVEKNGNLDAMVADLNRKKYKNEISENYVTYSIANDQKEIALTVSFSKNGNDIW